MVKFNARYIVSTGRKHDSGLGLSKDNRNQVEEWTQISEEAHAISRISSKYNQLKGKTVT